MVLQNKEYVPYYLNALYFCRVERKVSMFLLFSQRKQEIEQPLSHWREYCHRHFVLLGTGKQVFGTAIKGLIGGIPEFVTIWT